MMYLLVILKKSYLISRNKLKIGFLDPLPQLFFSLSYEYARSPGTDPNDFTKISSEEISLGVSMT